METMIVTTQVVTQAVKVIVPRLHTAPCTSLVTTSVRTRELKELKLHQQ